MDPLVTGVAQIPHCCVLRSVQQAAGSMEGRPPRSAPTGQCRQDQPGRFRFSFRSAPLFPWLVHKSGIKIIVFHSAPSRPTQLVAWEANEAKLSRASASGSSPRTPLISSGGRAPPFKGLVSNVSLCQCFTCVTSASRKTRHTHITRLYRNKTIGFTGIRQYGGFQ